jgi:hypothetical protein
VLTVHCCMCDTPYAGMLPAALMDLSLPCSTFAAGLSTYTDLRMVAPSLVTVTSWPRPMLCRILSCRQQQQQQTHGCKTMFVSQQKHCHGLIRLLRPDHSTPTRAAATLQPNVPQHLHSLSTIWLLHAAAAPLPLALPAGLLPLLSLHVELAVCIRSSSRSCYKLLIALHPQHPGPARIHDPRPVPNSSASYLGKRDGPRSVPWMRPVYMTSAHSSCCNSRQAG